MRARMALIALAATFVVAPATTAGADHCKATFALASRVTVYTPTGGTIADPVSGDALGQPIVNRRPFDCGSMAEHMGDRGDIQPGANSVRIWTTAWLPDFATFTYAGTTTQLRFERARISLDPEVVWTTRWIRIDPVATFSEQPAEIYMCRRVHGLEECHTLYFTTIRG